jgi:hypothetical protein
MKAIDDKIQEITYLLENKTGEWLSGSKEETLFW